MISEESFRIFSYVIRVGDCTKIFPYTWNPGNYKVEVVPRLNRWRLIAVASLMVQWTLVYSALMGVLEPGTKLSEWMFMCMIILSEIFTTVIQLYNLLFPAEFASLLSAVHVFARKMALYHKLDMKKDGMERLTKPFLVPIAVLPFLAGIGDAIMVHKGDRLYKYFRTEYLGLNILVGVAWGYLAVFPFFTGAFFVILAVNYCNSMGNFLSKIRFDPDKSKLQLRRNHLLFRAHQVLHVQAMEFTSTLIALILGMSCLVQIACICTMINLIGEVPFAAAGLMIVSPIVVVGATKACLDFAMTYTRASKRFPISFQDSCKLMRYGDAAQMELHRSQRRIFRTYRPFHFKIGAFMDINETTFVVVTSDFVFEGVWSILLM